MTKIRDYEKGVIWQNKQKIIVHSLEVFLNPALNYVIDATHMLLKLVESWIDLVDVRIDL